MLTKNTNTNVRNTYLRNNRIRTKLLLFIDNELQSKIKQNNYNLKFTCGDEAFFSISFEETFIQEEKNKYIYPASYILKTKQNDNSNKSSSTNDGSSNKNTEKSHQNEITNIHSKTFNKEDCHPNKLLNNNICFHKKIYSIKILSRQSSTFLILPKQKNAADYLKNLCNNLKICKKDKDDKTPVKHFKSININSQFCYLNNDKKTSRKFNQIIMRKSKKDNLYNHSLFRKTQKGNFEFNSKHHRIYGKSTRSIFTAIEQKE